MITFDKWTEAKREKRGGGPLWSPVRCLCPRPHAIQEDIEKLLLRARATLWFLIILARKDIYSNGHTILLHSTDQALRPALKIAPAAAGYAYAFFGGTGAWGMAGLAALGGSRCGDMAARRQ